MSDLFQKSLHDVIAVSASSSPTPGGGSVSAVTASFGAAMVAMVANLTIGKEKYKDIEPQVQDYLAQLQGIINKLEQLVADDMQEFENYMAVFKLPKQTEEEKAARAAAMEAAAKAATEVPLSIGEACLEILKIADALAPIGNKMAISDVGVGAHVAEASLKGALLSVDINLPVIKDQEYVSQAADRKNTLIAEAEKIKESAVSVVQSRL